MVDKIVASSRNQPYDYQKDGVMDKLTASF